ncbi:MAG: (d)CMP kinase [Desulfobacterales bacterium]|nr:(d)CMP kinase [Desulfobacterales bacterium]
MKTIGKYNICGLLGKGGMGKVYKVTLPMIDKIAALKVLDPNPLLVDLIGWSELTELFTKEAKMIAKIRHPNIVEIWDFEMNSDKPYYLMDYYWNNLGTMIGETYRTDAPSRIIKVDKAIDYTSQLLEGIACLHYSGIVHRDIKPFNILLNDEQSIKIGDFGLSKLRGEMINPPASLKVGSPWYAAPEQEIDPNQAGYEADLYSVGVILYRMVTGKLPESPIIKPSSINLFLDKDWDEFILTSINTKVSDRYQSAIDMLTILNQVQVLWNQKKEKMCFFQLDDNEKPIQHPIKPHAIRYRRKKFSQKHIQTELSIDALSRPLSTIENQYVVDNMRLTVYDQTTERTWQKSNSPYPCTWNDAHTYIHQLNDQGFAGYHDWRLPTITEWLTLMKPFSYTNTTDFCISPMFDNNSSWFWSNDSCSYISAWCVNMELGFVCRQDMTCHLPVRAVRYTPSLIITIDGPAGAGKTTVSRILASKLGFSYIDTGALYRGLAYAIIQANIDPNNDQAITAICESIKLNLISKVDGCHILLNQENITLSIRTRTVTMMASAIAKNPIIRNYLMSLQRQLAEHKNVVFEGRDMGTVVFPNAEIKFFLFADPKIRALRRYKEVSEQPSYTLEQIEQDISKRDKNDSSRDIAPLKAAHDAIQIDSTDLDLDQVVQLMLSHISEYQ